MIRIRLFQKGCCNSPSLLHGTQMKNPKISEIMLQDCLLPTNKKKDPCVVCKSYKCYLDFRAQWYQLGKTKKSKFWGDPLLPLWTC